MPHADPKGPWSAVRRAPMLRMALPFVGGLLLGGAWSPAPGPVLAALALGTVPCLVLVLAPDEVGMRWRRGVAVMLWYLVFGMAWQALRDAARDPLRASAMEGEAPLVARIGAVNAANDRVFRADAELLAAAPPGGFAPVRGSVLLTLLPSGGPWPRAGDVLALQAPIAPIQRIADPGGFDRAAWAKGRGITEEAFAPAGHWRVLGHEPSWTDLFRQGRDAVDAWLRRSALHPPERAMVRALVLGQRDELDSELTTAFARSGTIHVLAVSGLHVGLVYSALVLLVGRWRNKGRARIATGILILAALWGYAGITGGAPSVLRAAFMFSLFTVAGMSRRQTDHLNSLAAAAFFLLLSDPGMLRHAGFQLSFLAVLGIILFYRPVAALWAPKPWLLRQAWSLSVVSFSAQLLTAPVSILLFKAFPIWFLPANLIVVTAVGFAVYGGVALIALHAVPWLGDALAWCLGLLLKGVAGAATWFSGLPWAYPAVVIDPVQAVLLYAVIGAVAAAAVWRWRRSWTAALICACAAALIGAWQGKRAVEARTLVVYDDREMLLASILEEGRMLVLASSGGAEESPQARIKVERHARVAGPRSVEWAATGEEAEGIAEHGAAWCAGGRWLTPAFDVRFASDRSPRDLPARPHDAVILHDLSSPDALDVPAWSKARQWVIAAGVRPWLRRRLAREAEGLGIPVHVVADRGAFILSKQ